MKTTILLVDDHEFLREGLAAELAHYEDLQVVGMARDAREAYQVARETQPALIVLDMSLPDTNGVAAIPRLLDGHEDARILILSGYARNDYVTRAFAAGASGFALKSQPKAQIVEAIRRVAAGGRYCAEGLEPSPAPAGVRAEGDETAPFGRLTPREREVFDLLVRGRSNVEIAEGLAVAIKTVETHRARILRKLGVHSVAELVRLAALEGAALE
ncbi:MAG TPA: response regulator transcription factor [Polyangia bacterium]|nr:response regulator transcription factor [Polyangia bacterium]